VVFGLLIAFMVLMGLGALAVYTGTIDSPFDEPIQTPGGNADSMPPPCVPQNDNWPDGAPPLAYDDVRVRVYNAADYSFAIAGANADVLAARGFDIRDTGDFSRLVEGPSEIRYGSGAVRQAYTLAAQFPSVRLVLDDRPGRIIDLVVGEDYTEPLPVDQVQLAAGEPMTDMEDCVPVGELTPVPREFGEGDGPESAEDDAQDA